MKNISSVWSWQHRLLSPLYWYQAKQVKRDTLRLDEPKGAREGVTAFITPTTNNDLPLRLLVLGDSAAAGVGVAHQSQALLGQLVTALSEQPLLASQYAYIDWQLHATSGHTSFELLQRLYIMPSLAVDIAVISIGVNDTVKNISPKHWQHNIQTIIAILQRKFQAKHIVFMGLPPMQQMPALPKPLNYLIGDMASRLDHALQQQITQTTVVKSSIDYPVMQSSTTQTTAAIANTRSHVHFLAIHIPTSDISRQQLFAKDGFHPSALTYGHWAQQIQLFMVYHLVK